MRGQLQESRSLGLWALALQHYLVSLSKSFTISIPGACPGWLSTRERRWASPSGKHAYSLQRESLCRETAPAPLLGGWRAGPSDPPCDNLSWSLKFWPLRATLSSRYPHPHSLRDLSQKAHKSKRNWVRILLKEKMLRSNLGGEKKQDGS